MHLSLQVGHIDRCIPKCHLVDSTGESITQSYHTVAFIFFNRQFIGKIYGLGIIGIECREVRGLTLLIEAECQVNPLVGRECMLRIAYHTVYAEVVVTLYLLHAKGQLGLSVTMTEDSAFTADSYPHVYSEALTDEVDVGLGLCYSAFAASSLECHIVSHLLTVECCSHDEVTCRGQAAVVDVLVEGNLNIVAHTEETGSRLRSTECHGARHVLNDFDSISNQS